MGINGNGKMPSAYALEPVILSKPFLVSKTEFMPILPGKKPFFNAN
jgi:hypothetical protein